MPDTTAPARRGWSRLKRFLQILALLGACLAGVLAALYRHHVVQHPGEHLDRAHIRNVIAQESPVYYRDGTTRVGVFFEDEHRTYVAWEELPQAYRASIVAAEDSRFWSHPGFDLVHIARAMRDNLSAGKLVAGGSTLSQQTAKNLYYRPDRSLRSKLIEALNALRLEHHFAKSEILTFYANQFHVSGNGRGLGIAARHFFDKDVRELTVLESAFLAGLVKAPSYYDPFIGDADRRARATERAHDRTRYVLRRLTEVDAEAMAGPLPGWFGDDTAVASHAARVVEVRAIQAEAQRLLDDGFTLPFARGVFRFDSSAVLDEVARRLGEPPFDDVLATAGIDDPATAGLQVVTTLDVEAQRAATYGLWHHLTEMGVMLEELGVEAFVRDDGRGPAYDPDREVVPHEFRTAKVVEEVEVAGRRTLSVDLGGHRCLVDRDAIVRAAVTVQRGAVGSPTAKVPTAKVDAVVDALVPDTIVWVSVREVGDDGPVCDLEVRPELQGAVVVLEEGQIRAMVGGNDNRNFNRATAQRQFGSTWKPIVYHAAMEVGWSPDDLLDNRAGVFPFSTTFYYPRQGHVAPDEVSLAWAGVNSENLASVWLLYHLLDRLDDARFAELAGELGLAREAGETEDAYKLRVQKLGVLPTPTRVREAQFLQARAEVVGALARLRHPEDEVSLRSLSYGWGFDRERKRAGSARQKSALDHSWQAVLDLREQCGDRYRDAVDAMRRGEAVPSGSPALFGRVSDERVDVACAAQPEGFEPLTRALLMGDDAGGREILDEDGRPTGIRLPILFPNRRLARQLGDEADLRIGDRLHASTIDDLRSAYDRRLLEREVAGSSAPGLYDPEVLYWHQDFRTLMAMRFVKRMAQRYGVSTEIDDVLSMPLGAAEITLEEATKVYEGMISGQIWEFPGVGMSRSGPRKVGIPAATTLLIAEIRDVDGHLVYQAAPTAEQAASPEVAPMTADVLRNVVAHGTGRRAKAAVEVAGADVPLGGKTGTTNDFRNAAFLGFAPSLTGSGADERGAWIVGVYVGYDDNRPMSRRGIKLDGSRGALPAWVSTVQGLGSDGLLGVAVPPSEGWASAVPEGLRRVSVEPDLGGLPMEAPPEAGPSVLTRPDEVVIATRAPTVPLEPVRRPIRIAPRIRSPDDNVVPEAEGRGVWGIRLPRGGRGR